MTAFYVSASGADANPGTYEFPWRTTTKVESGFGTLISPGDTIRLRAGDLFTPGHGDTFLYNSVKTGVTVESYDRLTGLPSPVGQRAGIQLAVGIVFGSPGADNVTLSNVDLSTTQPTSGAGQNTIIANDIGAVCRNWVIKNCLLHGAGGSGIILNNAGSTGWLIDSCDISSLGDNGILLNGCGGGHTIRYCNIRDVGFFNNLQGRHGIYAHCHDYAIYGNEFSNIPNGQAISMRNNGAGSSGIAYSNYIHDTPAAIAFFADGDTSTGLLKVFANRIINVTNYGIYVGENPSALYYDTLIANNTVVGTLTAAVGIDCEDVRHSSSIVKNNIVQGFVDAFYMPKLPLDAGKTVTEDYNLFYGQTRLDPFFYLGSRYTFTNYRVATGQSAHSIIANPSLGPGPVYPLQLGSPAIGAATTDVAGLVYTNGGTGTWSATGLDYVGTAPDLGAVEYIPTIPANLGVAGRLGCGIYDAYVVERGGGSVVAALDWTSISWARVLDDTSEAEVILDRACVAALAGVRPWQHELAIYRDNVLVWVGPVFNPTVPFSGDHQQYRLVARDITAWWDRRFLHVDHDYTLTPTDLATIFQAYSDDAMSVDNSPGLVLSTTSTGTLGSPSVLAAQNLIAGVELRALANIGVDWTAIGRIVLAGGKTIPLPNLGTLTDENFVTPPVPGVDGSSQANTWRVRGAGGGVAGDSIIGSATADGATIARDGVLEAIDSISTIQDNLAAQAAAQTKLALTGQPIIGLQEAQLEPTAPVTIDALIPGALVHVELIEPPIPVDQQFRLQKVAVVATGNGGEQVSITLQPLGTT